MQDTTQPTAPGAITPRVPASYGIEPPSPGQTVTHTAAPQPNRAQRRKWAHVTRKAVRVVKRAKATAAT